ncbi:MAG: hypothetical protein ACE368_03505 [Paracoccaceae bacterium]
MGQVAPNLTSSNARSGATAVQTQASDPELTFGSGFMDCKKTAAYIRNAVYAEFCPENPWEDLLVEELAQLTIKLRKYERQQDLVLRAHAFDFVHQEILSLQRLRRLDGVTDDLRALVDCWAFGSHEAHTKAAKRLLALGVSLDGAMARAAAACVDDLDTIDQASSRVRRQRERLKADFQAQRQARARAEVPDAEVVE